MITIRAYANCDHAFVAWRPDTVIEGCLGFALFRRPEGQSAEIVETFVGPKTETAAPAGTHRPSTVWPIQKFMWADPFGNHPVVITGSHDLGPKASAENDDNLVIIENDPSTAAAYAVNIITIYEQYRWRFQQQEAARNHTKLNQWNGLTAPWDQSSYFQGAKKRELEFWL